MGVHTSVFGLWLQLFEDFVFVALITHKTSVSGKSSHLVPSQQIGEILVVARERQEVVHLGSTSMLSSASSSLRRMGCVAW